MHFAGLLKEQQDSTSPSSGSLRSALSEFHSKQLGEWRRSRPTSVTTIASFQGGDGATHVAEWRTRSATFDQLVTLVTTRGEEPLVEPGAVVTARHKTLLLPRQSRRATAFCSILHSPIATCGERQFVPSSPSASLPEHRRRRARLLPEHTRELADAGKTAGLGDRGQRSVTGR